MNNSDNQLNDPDQWRYSAIQVTKYNPKYRDDHGRYMRDEWTDYSCIGMIINGQKITYEQYLLVETCYVEAVKLFLHYYGCTKIEICNVEKYETQEFQERDIPFRAIWHQIKNGYIIDYQELESVLRILLRSYVWGELFCIQNREIAVRFGYDYYMMFNNGNGRLPDDLKQEIQSLGLFVEDN